MLILALLLAPQVTAPAPLPPLPSPQQLAWHELEYYAFVHFNMNTFTDLEWGHGVESPDSFAPSELDCRQWTRIFKAAGMRGVILTAKHHDGFCLWPSKLTEHSVASSAWREGKGDVLRELSEACRAEGLLFGVYLSPWDRNHPDYGDSPAYNEVFAGQLEEVLGSYGDVFEVWFDGANGEGPNGKRQVYDWPLFHETVFRQQPEAIVFSDAGPGCRWVGNERGFAGETNWAMLRRDEFAPGLADQAALNTGHEDGTHWVPAECDVSIRPGWYYHPEQDGEVKDLAQLIEIWQGSVGRNGNLLLNIPVDRRGLVHENDAARLMELRRWLDATYTVDRARGATAASSHVRGDDPRFSPQNVLDGDPATYWATGDDVRTASLTVELPEPRLVDRIVLREPIALGQRVRAFTIDVPHLDGWREHARGTTIGRKRIVEFPPVTVERLRVGILDARAAPLLAELSLHLAPPEVRAEQARVDFVESGSVRLSASAKQAEIRYTLDGSEPTRESRRFLQHVRVERSCTLRAKAWLGDVESLVPCAVEVVKWDADALLEPQPIVGEFEHGLRVTAYQGGWQSLTDLKAAAPVSWGIARRIDLEARPSEEHFALVFEGFVHVAQSDVVAFHLTSDDGSRLWIGGELLVDNDGLHGELERTARIGLREGLHALRVEYFNATGSASLDLAWSRGGAEPSPIPRLSLTHH